MPTGFDAVLVGHAIGRRPAQIGTGDNTPAAQGLTRAASAIATEPPGRFMLKLVHSACQHVD